MSRVTEDQSEPITIARQPDWLDRLPWPLQLVVAPALVLGCAATYCAGWLAIIGVPVGIVVLALHLLGFDPKPTGGADPAEGGGGCGISVRGEDACD